MPKLSTILQDRHDRALRRFKDSRPQEPDNCFGPIPDDKKSEHQKTHERFNPGGRAIAAAMRGDE